MSNALDCLTGLPGLHILKSTLSLYLGITNDFAKLLGWKSAEECIGKKDYDIPCKAVEFADEFIKMDKKVIVTEQKMLALDVQPYASGWKLVLVERNPIKIQNEVGLFNHCIDVSTSSLFSHYVKLHQSDIKKFGAPQKPTSYTLTAKHSPLALLTAKQEQCLFFLVRGKSIKEVAKILNLSPRTVECHLDAIKNKLKCQTKSDVIDIAINTDFLYYIPEELQKEGCIKIIA